MVNSMELLLSTASRVSPAKTNTTSLDQTAENAFEHALQNELGLSSENNNSSSEGVDLESLEEETTDIEQIEDQPTDTQNVNLEDSAILNQLMLIAQKDQHIYAEMPQENSIDSSGKNSSPEFVDTISRLGEFIVLKAEQDIDATEVSTSQNTLTNSVKSDSDNVFSMDNFKELMFNTRLQKLCEGNAIDQIQEKTSQSVSDNQEPKELMSNGIGNSEKLLQKVSSKSDHLSQKTDLKSDYKSESNLISSNALESLSTINELENLVSFDQELVSAEQSVEGSNLSQVYQKESIFNQMTQSITYGKLADGQYLNVKLKPDYLGEMSINIQKSAAGSVLNIQVESESVKKVLNEKIDELLTVLSDKFITIDKVMVTTETQSQNNTDSFSQQLGQHEFENNQSDNSRQTPNKKDYMTLDAVKNDNNTNSTIYELDTSKVSIYV